MNGRRLAAILIVDAQGFSTRMNEDEVTALAAISACMEILERTTGTHGGRVVKTMGDGLMAEFSSVVSAVSAAASMQARISERDRDVPPEGQFRFRIGVHVGDVMVQGDDLLGDGVNIAARLEAEAEPGGVLISSRVHEDIIDKLDLEFKDQGERQLKGIARPMRVYALQSETSTPHTSVAPTLPDKPSIAVLPFTNMSSDPEQDFFADGLTEDIITGLATVPWIFVIARNSSFVYKGSAVDVRKVGHDLGVAYVLEGSVRKAGARLRVTGQLVDAKTGAHLWAEKMDGALEDVFDLQDQVTEAVIRAIAPEIQQAEIEKARAKRPGSLTAYDNYHRGLAALHRANPLEAADHLDRAIETAPEFSKALALRSWIQTLKIAWLGMPNHESIKTEGLQFSEKALLADAGDPETAAYAGYTLAFFAADVTRGIGLVRRAAAACPSFYWAHSSVVMLESIHEDDPEGTLKRTYEAMRLSPRDPFLFRDYVSIMQSHRKIGQADQQLEAARLGLQLNPNITVLRIGLITALVDLERLDEARIEGRCLLDWNPTFSTSKFLEHSKSFQSTYNHNEIVRPRLEAAGLPT